MGFEPLVNQRLLPPTFPRYTVIKSREECVSYMETLLTQLHILPQITEMLSLHTILVSTVVTKTQQYYKVTQLCFQ